MIDVPCVTYHWSLNYVGILFIIFHGSTLYNLSPIANHYCLY
jgi:hypothetical protein